MEDQKKEINYKIGDIEKGFYTFDEILDYYEELFNEYESLKNEYDDYVAMVQDNYVQVPIYRQV